MPFLSTLRSWTLGLFLAGTSIVGCSKPTSLQESECVSASCSDDSAENSPEEPLPEPELFCPEGKVGDAYWRLPDGELGDLAEDCAADQLCLGGLCAKLGIFAYISDRSGEAEVHQQEGFLSPLQLTQTIPGVSPQSPDWSPDGQCMVFELMQGLYSNLYLLCLNGSGGPLTFLPGYNSHPSYDSNGEKVTFSTTLDGTWNLFTRKIQGTDMNNLVRLTNLPYENYGMTTPQGEEYVTAVLDPDVCQNGDWIVFRCDYRRDIDEDNFSENSEICKMRRDRSEFTRLTFSEHVADHSPACSPDGRWIAFASSRYYPETGYGNDDVFVMDIDGQQERRITTDPASEQTPAFSSDGKLIGYERYLGGYSVDLWITDLEGKEHLQLTSDPGREYDLAWKP